MSKQTHRVAVIGRTGRGDYGHWLDKVWKDLRDIHGNVELVAVADENETGAKQSAERIGAPRTYTDYRQMLERERPRFVTVAPRHADCHRDMILACAAAGANVFTEKPVAETVERTMEVCKLSSTTGVPLFCATLLPLFFAVSDAGNRRVQPQVGHAVSGPEAESGHGSGGTPHADQEHVPRLPHQLPPGVHQDQRRPVCGPDCA